MGLGHTNPVFTPTVLPLSTTYNVLKAYSGPLSMHTVFLTGTASSALSRSSQLPSVDYETLRDSIQHYLALHHKASSSVEVSANIAAANTQQLNTALKSVRETIATAFSSISILNASFLHSSAGHSSSHSKLCIDLPAVRAAYDVIMSTEAVTPLVVNTLGRATLQLTEHLRECPLDDAENLSVFLILLENPLMLRPADFHVAIEVVRGIC